MLQKSKLIWMAGWAWLLLYEAVASYLYFTDGPQLQPKQDLATQDTQASIPRQDAEPQIALHWKKNCMNMCVNGWIANCIVKCFEWSSRLERCYINTNHSQALTSQCEFNLLEPPMHTDMPHQQGCWRCLSHDLVNDWSIIV